MPHAGNPFAPSPDSKAGRGYFYKQMEAHNNLVNKAKPVSDCHIDPFVEQYSEWMAKSCRWKLDWNQERARIASDNILKEQIQKIQEGKVCTTDCSPSRRCEKYREQRRKRPTWVPGWTEKKWLERQAHRHESLIKKAATCVDTRLGIEHQLFKDFREKNGGPLPPIDFATPAQSLRKQKRRGHRRAATQLATTVPAPVCEQVFVTQSEQENRARERMNGALVDPGLIKYIYTISTQAASNDDVVDMLKQRTRAKYPDVYSSLEPGERPKKYMPPTPQQNFHPGMLPSMAATTPAPVLRRDRAESRGVQPAGFPRGM